MSPRPDSADPPDAADDPHADDHAAAAAEQAPLGLTPWVAAVVTFFSSAAVLVLEITALRLIAPYVGITMETNTAVIGLALAAIAFGAWAGGATADRTSPRGLIGPLLVLGGALVLTVSPAIRWVTAFTPPEQSAAMALLLAAVTVFAPAAVLSAIPPMVVKLQLSALTETGSVVGRLSAIGTLGAIAATFLTGFVLVALLRSSVILLVTGVLLMAGGFALVLTTRRAGVEPAIGTAGALTLAVASVGLGLLAPDPCEVETRYHCASVVADPDREGGHTLVLDTLRHSYVDLDDPAYLEFAYVRTLAGALDTHAPADERLDVLHVGGGAMTLPRYEVAHREAGTNSVVEIDPGVVDLVREELPLPESERLTVDVQDGRVAVAALETDSYDVYVGDAFGGVAAPWHLATAETFADVDRVLRPDGLVALNIIDYEGLDFLAAEVATLRTLFEHVAVLTHDDRPEPGGNFVVLASHAPLDPAAVEAATAEHGGGMRALTPERVDELAEGAEVLTDDHAPVDQLFTGRS
ncbi:Spermidine synthase [Serinicoccus hydrothermalis]|uniref:Spermidine synthase n=1 Tax=Serinicoccus hydrothermalis TaxID=1758689 RepID=A0A1B1NDZ0_9MICO|nr:fused MFS/spermidine synthase [Serinicoccus hydrothermalis]ANS79652.1 Spermidine synthase [Serinicoccus hydrothermalis]